MKPILKRKINDAGSYEIYFVKPIVHIKYRSTFSVTSWYKLEVTVYFGFIKTYNIVFDLFLLKNWQYNTCLNDLVIDSCLLIKNNYKTKTILIKDL
jgi:hypothetical protein